MDVRTTISLTTEETEFLRKNKLSPSTITKIAIDEFLKGKISEHEIMNIEGSGTEKVTVWIDEERKQAIKEKGITLSYLVRAKIRELMS